jgi:phosphoglycolate phosphatase
MRQPLLLLFDVDGTLVLTGGAGARAMACAFEELFGVADAFQGAQMAGRTDHAILAAALDRHDLQPDAANLARFPEAYVSHLRREIQKPDPRKGVMPGIRPLLDRLAALEDVRLGLLTGNTREGARAKLEYFDLWKYFQGGAFGDDVPDRNLLLPLAIHELAGCDRGRVFAPVVIGDTPLDIACAAAGQARCVAVATGSYDRAALEAAGGQTVFDDLADTEAVLCALGC